MIALIPTEHEAALARMDADLTIAASHMPANVREVHFLRRRVLAAYRDALGEAAGVPLDPRWNVLALTIAAFVTRIAEGPRSSAAAAAVERLRSLRFELLPELFELPGSLAGEVRVVQS
ncbi:MAG TPA: hypothetical protein VGP41_00440 [Candidatus Lustribacter sp.]|jgi:hypothetical protein|nr:hypothetical protein [Candidatus Lustribacter sp.]